MDKNIDAAKDVKPEEVKPVEPKRNPTAAEVIAADREASAKKSKPVAATKPKDA